jgi:hypothetical protein
MHDDDVLDLLARAADHAYVEAYAARLLPAHNKGRLWARAKGKVPGGRRVTFLLEVTIDVTSDRRVLRVVESEPRWLPKFCPGRHVNRDGSFCLGLGPIPLPTTVEAARLWWKLVQGYLEMQIEADLLGEWDPQHEWPHGDAAYLLARAERIEAGLPTAVVEAARDTTRPLLRTAACPCGSGRRVDRCHLQVIDDLRALWLAAADRERDFWSRAKDAECCGTLKVCPLRARTPVFLRSSAGRLRSRFA